MLWLTNLKNDQIFGIFYLKHSRINLFFILPLGKSIFYNFQNYYIFWVFTKFLKNEKINSIIKLSNNSSFVILKFATLKIRNFIRSTFRRSKFWPPPILIRTQKFKFFSFRLSLIRYFTLRNFDHSYICFRFKFFSTSLCS